MRYFRLVFVMVLALTLVLAPIALAQEDESGHEGSGSFKKTWNHVWKFINFFILVFIIVKYGRKPLVEFLRKHSSDIGDRLGKQNALLEEAQREYSEVEGKLAHLEGLIADVQEYMRKDAQRSKEDILAGAEETASVILDEAKERAEHALQNAQSALKKELVELAIHEAEKTDPPAPFR